jgi:hypothetical protein
VEWHAQNQLLLGVSLKLALKSIEEAKQQGSIQRHEHMHSQMRKLSNRSLGIFGHKSKQNQPLFSEVKRNKVAPASASASAVAGNSTSADSSVRDDLLNAAVVEEGAEVSSAAPSGSSTADGDKLDLEIEAIMSGAEDSR